MTGIAVRTAHGNGWTLPQPRAGHGVGGVHPSPGRKAPRLCTVPPQHNLITD
jgi:hypothetical protein